MTSGHPTLRWAHVPGGTCRFGDRAVPRPVPDLLVATTPLRVGDLGRPDTDPDRPLTGIHHGRAVALAADLGGRLPTSLEWEWIAAGPDRRPHPWGNEPWEPRRAQLTGDGQPPRGPAPVDAHPDGATPDGVLGLAGNVWEWTANPVPGSGYVIRGGSYASKPLYARTTFLNAAPAELTSPGIGVRVVRTA